MVCQDAGCGSNTPAVPVTITGAPPNVQTALATEALGGDYDHLLRMKSPVFRAGRGAFINLPSLRLPALGLAAALALAAVAGSAQAAGPYLHGYNAQALLPPPPALGSAEDAADRDAAFAVYSRCTPQDMARGRSEHLFTIFEFAPQVGPFFRPESCPKLAKLFEEVTVETKATTNPVKAVWNRPRPYVADPVRFSSPGDKEKNAAYPSGHSTQATVFAALLSEIFPDRRAAILAQGRAIGWTRVQIGVHTPLDIYAGRVLGQALARAFLGNPQFQNDFAEAKAEALAAERAAAAH